MGICWLKQEYMKLKAYLVLNELSIAFGFAMCFPCVASLTFRSGELRFYDYVALQIAITAMAPARVNDEDQIDLPSASAVAHPGIVAEVPVGKLQADGEREHDARPRFLDGFTIEQWAAYARLKSRVASSVCKDNGKRKL